MRNNIVNIKKRIISAKSIIITLLFILSLAFVSKFPIKFSNVSLEFNMNNLHNNNKYNVTLMDDDSNAELYRDVYKNNVVRFRLDPDYYDANEIFITSDSNLGTTVNSVKIYAGKYIEEDKLIGKVKISKKEIVNEGNSIIINTHGMSKITNIVNNNKPLRIKFIKILSIIYILVLAFHIFDFKELMKNSRYRKITTVIVSGHILFILLREYIIRYRIEIGSIWWKDAINISYVLLWVFIFLLCYKEFKINYKIVVNGLYIIMIIYSVIQGGFYIKNIHDTPDELAHISYIAYLEESDKVIPDFEEMHLLKSLSNGTTFNKNTINYLGHSPLYYHIMRICRGVEAVGNDQFIIHDLRMRVFSFGIGMIGMLILFYIGYTRINKKIPCLHMFYISAIIGVPMSIFNITGVNNDTLTLVACSLWFLGMIRFTEGKKNLFTYLLIALGISTVTLGKLTAGLLVGIASLIFIVWYMIKNKDLKAIINKKFIITIPIYLFVVAYFLLIYSRYGAFQPSLQVMDFGYFKTTSFYTDFINRAFMGVEQYFKYYWSHFFSSWTSVATHPRGTLIKQTDYFTLGRIFYILIFFAPIVLAFIKKSKKVMLLLSSYIAIFIVAIIQCYSAYNAFMFSSGYLGGFSSRYYLCVLGILSFAITYLLQYLYNKKQINKSVCLECGEENNYAFYPYRRLTEIICITSSVIFLYNSYIYYLVIKIL